MISGMIIGVILQVVLLINVILHTSNYKLKIIIMFPIEVGQGINQIKR